MKPPDHVKTGASDTVPPSDSASAIYELEQLIFQHGDRFRLEIEQLRVKDGERLAIVGPNGSGKTTLLRILAFLDRPVSWQRFTFRGQEHAPDALRRGDLAFLRQQPYLFDGSARENLAYPLRLRRIARRVREERIDAMLAQLELTGRMRLAARRLSGGEQKRLALGRVLIAGPSLFLLDEPTAHLDSHSQTIIEQVLLRTAATLIFSTHDVRLAHRLATRLLHLRDGRISAVLPENVFSGQAAGGRIVTAGGLAIAIGERIADGPAKIAIDPRSVVLSHESFASSMRNQFSGRIVALQDHSDGIWVEVDCGERLIAIVTRQSYEGMGLNLGAGVVVSFKAQAVEVL